MRHIRESLAELIEKSVTVYIFNRNCTIFFKLTKSFKQIYDFMQLYSY